MVFSRNSLRLLDPKISKVKTVSRYGFYLGLLGVLGAQDPESDDSFTSLIVFAWGFCQYPENVDIFRFSTAFALASEIWELWNHRSSQNYF